MANAMTVATGSTQKSSPGRRNRLEAERSWADRMANQAALSSPSWNSVAMSQSPKTVAATIQGMSMLTMRIYQRSRERPC